MARLIIIISFLFFSACSENEKPKAPSSIEKITPVDIIETSKLIPETVVTTNCVEELINAPRDNNLELAKTLLEQGCDVNGTISNRSNRLVSPLRYGIHHDDSEMAKLLLSYGADPCQDLGREMSPFHYSLGGSPFETFLLLVDKCKNVNTINLRSNFPTPLIWAISQGKTEHVKVLLKKGAKINPDSTNGYSVPLEAACSYNRFDIFKLLLEKGADVNAQFSHDGEDCIRCPYEITVLHNLVYMNEYTDKTLILNFLEELMKYNPDINIESKSGYTPLEYACFGKDTKLVKWLFNRGAKLETEGYSAIHCAAMFSNAPIVELLLKLGADPNTKTKQGNNPITVSYNCCGDGFGEGITDANRLETARLLLKFGADSASLIKVCQSDYKRSFCDSIDIE